jgi:cytochrome c oxidase assembly protein subunit 15
VDTHTHDNPWIHRWAVFTAAATFALVFLGSLVTTLRVGMADPIWPTYPWHLALIDWTEPKAGFIIEHTHRAAGYFVGCCIIVLMLSLFLGQRRPALRKLGVVLLAAVIVQGLLGGLRVLRDRGWGQELALIHGCFAQLVFALTVSAAVVTSRKWLESFDRGGESLAGPGLRRATGIMLGLIYLQIVFGAVLRHTYNPLGPRGHLLIAFAVVAAVAWVLKAAWDQHRSERALFIPALALAGLVMFQLMMGVEAWMLRYTAVSPGHQLGVRTTHVLIGSLILAAGVVTTLQARRGRIPTTSPASDMTNTECKTEDAALGHQEQLAEAVA